MDLNTMGATGLLSAIATIAGKRLFDLFFKERQDRSLYAVEVEAHIKTRERHAAEIKAKDDELDSERTLRRAAEMELRSQEREHDTDRKAWRADREKDRELMEALKTEVAELRRKVIELTSAVGRGGFGNEH